MMKIKYATYKSGLLFFALIFPLLLCQIGLILKLKKIAQIPNLIIFSFLIALINVFFFFLLYIFFSKQKHPFEELSKIIEKDETALELQKIDPFFSELIDELDNAANTVNEQYNQITVLCNKYKKDIENISSESKIIKDEHDNYFTQMSTKESMNELIFEFVSHIILIVNKEGIVLDANHILENKLGLKKDEIIGKSIIDLVNVGKRKLSDLVEENEKQFLSFKIGSLDSKNTQYLNVKITELPNGNLMYTAKSVDEEITIQSRILRKNRELEYINQINSALISNWGLNELLTNIVNRIEYLFNVVSGTIRMLNEDGLWELKAKTARGSFFHEEFIDDYVKTFNIDILNSSEIKSMELDDGLRKKLGYPDELKQIVFAPLEVDGQMIAIIAIGLETYINQNDLNILKMFKTQASVVIQRALLYDKLRKQYFNTIQALVNIIEAKDKYTEGHSRRVSRFAVEIAKKMGYSNEELENIEIAGLLHDVGKVGINQAILTKEGKLSDEEYQVIKEHPEKGIHILQSIRLNDKIVQGILYHHVRYDLKGYPQGHSLVEIPQYAAIIGVADAFDAITSDRSYSIAEPIREGLEELKRFKQTQFHPGVIDAFELLVNDNNLKLQEIIDDIS